MKSARHLVAAASFASLAACGTVMPTAQSGFLSDYTALTAASDDAFASRASTEAIDPARVSVDAVTWRVPAGLDIDTDERDALLAQLRSDLQQQLRALPAQAQGRPAVLRAAITRVETVSPALNALSALFLVVPLDRGGAAVEIEAVDPQTGHQLAALTQGYFAPLSDLKARFSKLAPAGIAVRKAATDFLPLLGPAPDAGKKTALR